MSAEARPIERGRPYHRIVAGVAAMSLLGLVLMPWWGERASLRLATEMASYLTLAVMWNLLAGYAGVMSIGQQAFVGIGGYAFFVLAGFWGVPPLLALPLAGLVALLLAVPTGLLLFRLSGAQLAIGSWVLAEVYMLLVAQSDALGGGSGLSFPVDAARGLGSADARAAIIWWAALAIAAGSLATVYFWLRSPKGLALMALRDNPLAAATLGVDTLRTRLLVYLIASLFAGLVGAVAFFVKLRISPAAAFDVGEWTANIIFIVVIGGIGSLEGAIIGTLVYFLLRGWLADLGAVYLIILGTVAILVMLKAPRGLWGFVRDRVGIDLFALDRRLVPGNISNQGGSR
jgi:branched-chain amino acid transport system permease protein